LKLLERDLEFRHAVAGYLGFSEILKRLMEHDKKFNEILALLKKHETTLEEHAKALRRIEASLGSLGARVGIDIERAILGIYRDIFQSMGVDISRVEKISFKDTEGKYYRRGAKLELDIYAHNSKVFFIEVKSFVEPDDVEWFETRCEIFERILERKPDRRIIVAINVLRTALERARELGIDIIYGRVIDVEERRD